MGWVWGFGGGHSTIAYAYERTPGRAPTTFDNRFHHLGERHGHQVGIFDKLRHRMRPLGRANFDALTQRTPDRCIMTTA